MWHYTDAEGAFGIITTGCLYFGDVRYLNDRTELVYARRLIDDTLNAAIELGDEFGVMSAARRFIAEGALDVRLFACSFSESKDILSQWQRYGADGAGYCLGFDAAKLDKLLGTRVRRYRMIYDAPRQKHMLASLAHDHHAEYVQKLAGSSVRDPVWLYGSVLAVILEQASLQIKNPAFRDEREWRYIRESLDEFLDSVPAMPIKYIRRGPYIKPVAEFPRSTKTPPRLPLDTIVCGPRLDPEVATQSIRQFLRAQEYPLVAVEASALGGVWR